MPLYLLLLWFCPLDTLKSVCWEAKVVCHLWPHHVKPKWNGLLFLPYISCCHTSLCDFFFFTHISLFYSACQSVFSTPRSLFAKFLSCLYAWKQFPGKLMVIAWRSSSSKWSVVPFCCSWHLEPRTQRVKVTDTFRRE